jgi:hypothetical protein
VLRRVGAGALAWLLGLGAFFAVAHPERCPTPSRAAALAAAVDGVGWLAANQLPDGRFLYRWDRARDEPQPGYVLARHAGTLLALEQASRVGIARATAAADAGIAWALDRLTPLPGGRRALGADTGSSALLVAALVERRRIAGVVDLDPVLERLGALLLDSVEPDGAVTAEWDLDGRRPILGTRSPFFTGEVLFALARLHRTFPEDRRWGDAVRLVAHHLATARDDEQRTFPPVSDHWAGYAYGELGASGLLTHDDLAYARRQADLFGLQARFESQRRDGGIARTTRGRHALPAGLGTVGEGLGGIWRLAGEGPLPGVARTTVADRLACVAGMLVARQVHDREDVHVDGAWFRGDVTQVDDQQHAVSALLAALPVLPERGRPG